MYTLRRRAGMRSIRLTVKADGALVVSAAKYVPVFVIEKLIREKTEWIEEQREKMKTRVRLAPAPSATDYRRHKERALVFAKERVEHFAAIYGVTPKRISIRNTHTRWGSCSSLGAISFSYRMVFLPPHLADYLVVHELCHLKEMNHSKRFWALVAKTIPDCLVLRKQLKLA